MRRRAKISVRLVPERIVSFIESSLGEIKLSKILPVLNVPMKYSLSSGGKRLRPIICTLSTELVKGDINKTKEVFTAVELLHSASLVHDDIIDDNQFRRGQLSVPEKFGSKRAVLVGDSLFSLGLKYAAKTGNPRVVELLADACLKMVQGIALQSYNRGKLITEEEYLQMNYLKSGSLFEVSSTLGGIMASSTPEELEKLSQFGKYFGNAYQVFDDICDTLIVEKGRNDLQKGDISLPFIYALNSDLPESTKSVFLDSYKGKIEPDMTKIHRIFNESGAIDKSAEKMQHFATKARDLLDFFNDSDAKSVLKCLLDEYYTEVNVDCYTESSLFQFISKKQ